MLTRWPAEPPQRILQTFGQGDEATAPRLVVASRGSGISFGSQAARARLAVLADFNRKPVQFLRRKISCSECGGPILAV